MKRLPSRRFSPAGAFAAMAASLLAACSTGPDGAHPAIALESCRLPGVDAAARCGTYEVWEDREGKTGRRIKLDLAIVPARLRAKDPDPIVVLAGGPGQGAVSLSAQIMPLFTRLNDTRDVVGCGRRDETRSDNLHRKQNHKNGGDNGQPVFPFFGRAGQNPD